ncbi:formylmethanofuran dehydrogenase subunit C [Methanocaldococcus infernus ME]|uniref:Tungsten-containing formylmethanofuran dehydrogenase 2 subunit C n=1 Tax=Methanocaldococcus infernus (strain DSM 11812 / JCM 15783 / ME) TaxID=573063 RepID=D5VT85_METIM|nr:tungsten-dependent formylmethanofuran dehydrogenase subunit FwdC [Methanocaldococcus infernus]ADG13788.1 formylmethanofuran dehydrogenase subunit C [Methanocaldococcus infernus ME]
MSKEVKIILQEELYAPLSLENVLPEDLESKSLEDIKNIKLYYGNRVVKLSDMFDVEVNEIEGEPRLVIENPSIKIKHIGSKMSRGEIIVKGDAGMYAGEHMKGGKIVIEGNADNWLGMNMKGGEIIVKGSSRDYTGGTYKGEWRGMSGGRIVVEGNARHELGLYLRGGEIIVKGDAGMFAGLHQQGGYIIVEGNTDVRLGGEMEAGAIIVYGKVKEILPSFKYEGIVENPVIKIKKKDEGRKFEGTFYKLVGDYANGRKVKGQLYINVETNEGLF